jgi:polysaccharide export outer membrane protein
MRTSKALLPPWRLLGALAAAWLVTGVGCATVPQAPPPVPRELNKSSLPEYIIEPPDVLRIDAVRIVPKPPYRIQPMDILNIQVTEALPEAPIAGPFVVDPEGKIDLGYNYGTVSLLDLTIPEAQEAIRAWLKQRLKPGFQVIMSLAQSRALQLIRGEHLVGQDGRIALGVYGTVWVAGMTREQARAAIEGHLSNFLERPEVAVDLVGYNSKVYYVVTDGAGWGEQVLRLPVTGNETVLDAISQVYGLSIVSSKNIWLARPTPADTTCLQILPVNWRDIVEGGATGTNYQILPGDRIYVKGRPLIATDNFLARLFSPIERVLGLTLLGSSTVHSVAVPLGGSGTGF